MPTVTYINKIDEPVSPFVKIKRRLPGIGFNFLIYILSYAFFYIIKKQEISLDTVYINFLPVYLTAWLIGGIISGKFRFQKCTVLSVCLNRYYISILISVGLVSFLLSEIVALDVSRVFVVGSLFTPFLIETAIVIINYKKTTKTETAAKSSFAFINILLDLIILSWVIFFVYKVRLGGNTITANQYILIAATYLSWLLAGLSTHQFIKYDSRVNIWRAISTQLKFYLLLFSLVYFIAFILRLDNMSRTVYLTSIAVYSFWSFIIMLFLYIGKLPEKTDDVTTDFLHAYEVHTNGFTRSVSPVDEKYKISEHSLDEGSVSDKLKNIYLRNKIEIYSFIERKLHLGSFKIEKVRVVSSRDPLNITVFPEEYLELFINLHKLNDIRRINQYFIEVNKRLYKGGIFIGCFEPKKFRYERFRTKYPFMIAHVFYFLDFLWKRVTPKLPVMRKIYFALTNGTDRALPMAEGLGRLFYCGFDILDLKIIDNKCYFIARKITEPSTDKYPSYGLFFKMNRVGKDGKMIKVYKLRTMHPYSEYLQDFLFDVSGYNDITGKLDNDFRLTSWGKFLRKYWLDELPQLINFVKGEMKLVGVRPISKSLFNQYPEDVKKLRIKEKPGCIPPYVALLMPEMSDSIESEMIYLNDRNKNPFKTDIKYFFKAVRNILTNKIRSH